MKEHRPLFWLIIAVLLATLLPVSVAAAPTSELQIEQPEGYIDLPPITPRSSSPAVGYGTHVADTYIKQELPTTNYGDITGVFVETASTGSRRTRSIFDFDISGLSIGTLTSATFYAYYYYYYPDFGYANPVGRTIYAYELDPGNDGSDWVEDEATWNIYATGESWDTVGGDYVGTPASDTVPANYGWMEWDVTDIVQNAINEGWTVKLLLKWLSETGKFSCGFRSHEKGSNIPYLEIEYAPPAPGGIRRNLAVGTMLLF